MGEVRPQNERTFGAGRDLLNQWDFLNQKGSSKSELTTAYNEKYTLHHNSESV